MRRPVYLTGFMGAGKTTVGAALARQLGLPFVDGDLALTREAGMTPAEIFRQHGEGHFRALERRWVSEQLTDPSPRVVALGGGALLDRSLRLRVLERGTLLCLTASLDELKSRNTQAQPAALAGGPAPLGGSVTPGEHPAASEGPPGEPPPLPTSFAERSRPSTSPTGHPLPISPAGRPLLAGDPSGEHLRCLLELREDGYREAHAQVRTDGLSPEQVAGVLARQVASADLVVAAGRRSYPVRVVRGGDALREQLAVADPSSVLLVSDRNVAQHHAGSFGSWLGERSWSPVVLEPGEQSKGIPTLGLLWETLSQAGLDRRGLVLGVGGGVVTDLAGLAASTWLRGVRWIAAPSSLLGMVDAAIGGKTAIDLGDAKNVVGAFHQPVAVCIDIELLRTEPERSFVSGLAEVVKSALVGDAALLSLLEERAGDILARDPGVLESVVRSAASVKVGIVSRDEHEQGERRLLNLGHTLGHALEAQGGFQRRVHGEAVALGTVAALRVGERLGVTAAGLTERVERLLARLGLPWELDVSEIEASLPWLRHDKKREVRDIHYVLVAEPGRALVRRMAVTELEGHLRAICLE